MTSVDKIAETIWRAEYRRATGRERNTNWSDGVKEIDKDKYRYVADAVLETIGKFKEGERR